MSNSNQPFKKGYKYEIRPTQSQKDYLARAFGHNRFLWNQILTQLKEQYDLYYASGTTQANRNDALKPNYSPTNLSSRLTALKAIHPFLYEVSCTSLQTTTRHLSSAYQSFFNSLSGKRLGNKVQPPRFKSKYRRQAITLTRNGFSLNDNEFTIAKVAEPIKVLWSRDLPSEPSSAIISLESNGRYYISFTCEVCTPTTTGKGTTAIDLGLKEFAVTSAKEHIVSLLPRLKHIETMIKRLQRKLSRKTKGTIAYSKLKLRIAKWHEKLHNVRKDFYHKYSRHLVNQNQAIILEDLAVANMVKNHHLANAISLSAWSTFRNYVMYKAKESHHAVVCLVDRFYPSSKTCSNCGYNHKDLKLQHREWTCPQCNTHHHRDENAATNLLNQYAQAVCTGLIDPVADAGCTVLI